ncbi:hypothetical protein HDV57DRAFT_493514 [Trichoderma longibrachiatum]|uniref:DUF221-domain-containing protein n=1 Tax=Trichoderma longibrachiatum ATCC 18648 TaxID=983965 RepID=A0A2T4CFY4_TRILO|nr:DUF221-domain-containing protein [Trichoderma longibrachiatum ATCC 18648]
METIPSDGHQPWPHRVIMATASLARRATQEAGDGQKSEGIGIASFLTAILVSVIIFFVQLLLFVLLRNKLARIFKPKTYLVPERERTESPPNNFFRLIRTLIKYNDREVINKCGLDAYFFLRYLKTLLIIFIPICAIVVPILVPINYVGGRGKNIDFRNGTDSDSSNNSSSSSTDSSDPAFVPTGLDTLAWGNVKATETSRYGAHLLMALLVIIWVCSVFFFEMRAYIKVRQDYLTSAEHRLRASATTVLVNSIPSKWLSEDALSGLFDVFPGGIRNIWINRDLTSLLDKVNLRTEIHAQLEAAETELIRAAKKVQLKRRNAEEKKQRKGLSKKEKATRQAEEDAEAKRMANSGEGTNDGKQHHVPHTVDESVRESRIEDKHKRKLRKLTNVREESHKSSSSSSDSDDDDQKSQMSDGSSVAVLKNIRGAFNKAGDQMDEFGTNNGFMSLARKSAIPGEDGGSQPQGYPSFAAHRAQTHSRGPSSASAGSTKAIRGNGPVTVEGNTVRKLDNINDMYNMEEPKFWQFWKTPAGGYASPVPQQNEGDDYMGKQGTEEKTLWQNIKGVLPFTSEKAKETGDYPAVFFNEDYKVEEEETEAEWAKYLKKTDRPTHRLSPWGISWLPGLPLISQKVDTIYWCRTELARLNMEIEEDQKHPERFPLMNSAFIQFNHQVAAHMACQSIIHHVPRQMAPRVNEISPRDVIWGNMALSWWQEWVRTGAVTLMVLAMIFLWAIPVAWTAALGQLDQLIQQTSWLGFLRDSKALENAAKAVAGVLPAAVLALLLFLVPRILSFLGEIKGAKTGAQKSEFVQVFYFAFLFVQVFLIVSIASFFAASIDKLVDNITELDSVKAVLDLLATNLPKAANYFFSYMILQALSTSSGTLLQIGALFVWFILARIFDNTARSKWARNTNLSDVNWGTFFPVYTNFACIAIIYSVVAPLISIFAVITFGLLWVAQRYSMLYVTRFEVDTGGVLYPRALNQTFTGIYVMELCLAGLFFIVVDDSGTHTCTPHGIVMIVSLILTILYQILLNKSFSPLFRYLPITFEDEAVLRDEAFQRAQDRRFGLIADSDHEDNEGADEGRRDRDVAEKPSTSMESRDDIELSNIHPEKSKGGVARIANPVKKVGSWAKGGGKQVGSWAKDGGNQLRKLALMDDDSRAAEYRRKQRSKDLEAQRAIGEALYGGIHDEIEDLTPEERDVLVRHAFLHSALRARRPVVWLPRDDLGISDDEVRRTRNYSEHIWISNEGTALDSKVRVVYGRYPPDFSEIDLINL